MQRPKQPIMILTCQHDSHYFEERTIVVNDAVKVGRAVARLKASATNAIFDCKVLSRNHANIWFKADEFWLRDTNSSNGTFINNTRVVKRDESEYCDRQIFSGDVIRFGVDVVENDTTHGCIIAGVTLFLPNGLEAKPKVGQARDTVSAGLIPISSEQMFQLSCFLNDTLFREQTLERKLESLQSALQETQTASELGWQAMLNEEKLLQKLDLYESQMRIFKEDLTDSSMKIKITDILEKKSLQEAEFKNQLNRILKEKESALKQVKELERTLSDLEEECAHMRDSYTNAQNACSTISTDYKASLASMNQRLTDITNERNQLNEQLARSSDDNQVLQRQLDLLSSELAALKEIHDDFQMKVKEGLPNGLCYNEESENGELINSKDVSSEEQAANELDDVISRGFPGDTGDESSKPPAFEYLTDSIRDFHKSLELIRLLKGKVSSGLNSSFPSDDNCVQPSLSGKPYNGLIQQILRYHGAAMTSLHAYLLQINPTAASELISKIHFNEAESTVSMLADSSEASRPEYLTFQQPNSQTSSSHDIGGVTIDGADSSGTYVASPTVSSNGCINFPLSTDPEELAPLKESIRLAHEEIAQYRKVIADLELSASRKLQMEERPDETKDSVESKDMAMLRAECEGLRAKIGKIEEQIQQTRENHHRLIEESRQHKNEVEQLHSERERLQRALADSQNLVRRLQPPTLMMNNTHTVPSSSLDDNQAESESFELLPRRLVTVSSLAVIPLMMAVFAIMFAIFSKFVS